MSATQWYWCLTHQRAETVADRDDPDNSLGPYSSEEAARDWKATSEARNQAWDEEDERWEGEDPPAP
jgi:hypothetical protein